MYLQHPRHAIETSSPSKSLHGQHLIRRMSPTRTRGQVQLVITFRLHRRPRRTTPRHQRLDGSAYRRDEAVDRQLRKIFPGLTVYGDGSTDGRHYLYLYSNLELDLAGAHMGRFTEFRRSALNLWRDFCIATILLDRERRGVGYLGVCFSATVTLSLQLKVDKGSTVSTGVETRDAYNSRSGRAEFPLAPTEGHVFRTRSGIL